MNTNTNLGSMLPLNCDLDKIAVIDLSKSAHSYSFKDIDQKSNAVARGLLLKNIKSGDKIAILADNSVDLISTFFGSMRAGIIPVLINTKLSDTQIKNILLDTESKLLFTDQQRKFSITTVNFENDFNNFLDSGDFEIYEPAEKDVAFIIYTSGSSGDPKGSALTHRGHTWAIKRNISYDSKWSHKSISLISAPLYHTNGLTTFEGAFASGATIVLLSKFNPLDCINAIEQYQVTTMFCVPTMMAMIIQEPCVKTSNLNSVKHIRSASSPFNESLLESVKQYFPNSKVLNSYGITEVGPSLFGPHPDGLPRPITSVGYPAQGIEYRLINGILHIKSPSMQISYCNDNTDDSLTEDGFFNTKDLFRIDTDGFYYFLGRVDDMFKCGANRVYPSEVQSIIESHPAVNSSFVIGVPDEIKGFKPYAFVVLKNGRHATQDDIKQHCLINGPAYQHPRQVWIIDQLPLTGSNKVDGQLLKDLAIKNLTN
jgi:acyl-coenzyme A synthetase/AMP-(fatty) acid ligase